MALEKQLADTDSALIVSVLTIMRDNNNIH